MFVLLPLTPLLPQAMPLGLTVEQLAAASGTFMLAVMIVMLLRGDLVTKRAHDQAIAFMSETIEAKNAEIARLTTDRDLWRDIAADALDVSEALMVRK